MRRATREDGQALIEAAITIPLLLLLAVGIFEFGRAYQTWQILTNAAREGARIAIVPNPDPGAAEARVRDYMRLGQLNKYAEAGVTVDRTATIVVNGTNVAATQVTINYPFDFGMLRPVALLVPGSKYTAGSAVTMVATSVMRNEM